MIRINTGSEVPKYQNGKWLWNDKEERLEFESRQCNVTIKEEFIATNGYKFKMDMNQVEEMIFRQEFQRPDTTYDADVILIQDIVNVVLFLAPSEFIVKKLINFLNTHTVNKFMKALIIYFEYFLKMVEFVLIRRDEISCEQAQIQSDESTEIKRIFSEHLSQHRLLLAREYSTILLGEGDMAVSYHIRPVVNISKSLEDKVFHERFLAVCTQVVWISMHRRAYDVIEMEMNRLFRSEHFKLTRSNKLQFSTVEATMLYGKNYKRVNYRAQNSPLIQEISNVAEQNLPILWIGERKYRGTDIRIHQLELEYIVPDSQLSLIDVSHGILGHPKKIYNTILKINWEAVRFENYNALYDPYRIIRQPYLTIPSLDAEKIRKQAKNYESFYQLVHQFEPWSPDILKTWYKRDAIISYILKKGLITNIWTKCQKDVDDTSYGPSVQEITEKFLSQKQKLRKN